MLKVAICIPCFEKIDLLRNLLESIKKQTCQDYLVILSDDSGDDAIQNWIALSGDDKIIYHHNEHALGATENTISAIQTAFEYAPAYIKIMHHDDYFEQSDALELMINFLDCNPDLDLLFCGCRDVFSDREVAHVCTPKEISELQKDCSLLYLGNSLGAPSVLLYRNIREVPDKNLVWLVDIEFYIRLLAQKHKFGYLDQVLVTIGHDGNQMTDYCQEHPQLVLREYLYLFRKLHVLHNKKCLMQLLHVVKNQIL